MAGLSKPQTEQDEGKESWGGVYDWTVKMYPRVRICIFYSNAAKGQPLQRMLFLCPFQCLLIRLMKKRDHGKSDVAFAYQYGLLLTKAGHLLTTEPQSEFLILFVLEETNQ